MAKKNDDDDHISFHLDLSELRSDIRSMPTQVEVLNVATEDKFRPKFF